jgi:hypothetical protein
VITVKYIAINDLKALVNFLRILYRDLETFFKGVEISDILWRIQPLLCNRRINSGVMQPVSRQQIGKHVPAATVTHAAGVYAVRAESL